jgi:hypothetical protein
MDLHNARCLDRSDFHGARRRLLLANDAPRNRYGGGFPGDVEGEALYPRPMEVERLARLVQLETRAGNLRATLNRPRQAAVAQARRSVDHGRRRDR